MSAIGTSGHASRGKECLLLGVKRTSLRHGPKADIGGELMRGTTGR